LTSCAPSSAASSTAGFIDSSLLRLIEGLSRSSSWLGGGSCEERSLLKNGEFRMKAASASVSTESGRSEPECDGELGMSVC